MGTRDCWDCNGRGRLTCSRCRGTGFDPPPVRCRACGGFGDEKCYTCNGTGTVPDDDDDDEDDN